jgi:protein-S-isoprenylcysteine O-methyltransferase Ste14
MKERTKKELMKEASTGIIPVVILIMGIVIGLMLINVASDYASDNPVAAAVLLVWGVIVVVVFISLIGWILIWGIKLIRADLNEPEEGVESSP